MRDELSLEMRRLVDRARRAEVPQDVDLKRRIRRAVALGIPAGTLLGSSAAAAGAGGANLGANAVAGTVAVVGKTSVGLLHGFLGWVAGGFAIGIGATTAYVGWHGTELRSPSALASASAGGPHRSVVARRPEVTGSLASSELAPSMPITATAIANASLSESTSLTQTANASPNAALNARRAPASNEPNQVPSPTEDTTNGPNQVPSLAEQVALLARVQQKLLDGQGRAVLEAVDEANRRFAHSQLEPDFQAARILAWCELGQPARARQAADAFLRAHANSSLTERVRHSCAFEDARETDESGNGSDP